VRWIEQLDPGWPVAFVPISIRYDTNRASVFYQALAARLASILGETPPSTPTDPAQFYKEKVLEYFYRFEQSQARCLIVVDGLDEANGWQLDPSVLPAHPPHCIRIVASARQLAGDHGSREWLHRLGWKSPGRRVHTLEVKPLKRAGIEDVLRKMGFPLADLAREVDIVDELFRLSEHGDPLLLGWYVSDLWDTRDATPRLRPEDLKKREPGYHAYFTSWFDEQRDAWHAAGAVFDDEKINTLLAVLACALGPITLAAIGEMMKRLLKRDCFVSMQLVAPLRRFVIGDGVDTGFALGHPKLADFIRHHYFGDSHIIDQTGQSFVAWGRDVVRDLGSGAMRPDKVPEYCLLFHVQHLESERPRVTPLMYRELVDDGWRRAWLAHDQGFRGFARDLEVVWARLKEAAIQDPGALRQPLTGLGGLVRCALCLSSIRSISAAVPPNFLAELLRQHLVGSGQALHLSRLKADESARAMALRALVPYLATEILHEAVAAARALANKEDQAVTLAALAQRLPEPERQELVDDAIRIAQACYESIRDPALEEIRKICSTQCSGETQARPRNRLPPASPAATVPAAGIEENVPLPAPDDLQGAIAEALACRSPSEKAGALAPVVRFMSPDQIEEAFAQTLQSQESVQFDVIAVLAPYLPDTLLSKAVQPPMLAMLAGNGLKALARSLPPEMLDEALTQLLSTENPRLQRDALDDLLPVLPAQLMAKALSMAMQGSDSAQYTTFQILVRWLPDELLDDALRATLKWEVFVAAGLKLLGPRMSAAMIGEAISAMADVRVWERTDAMSALIPHFHPSNINQALDAILAWDSDMRAKCLRVLAPSLGPEMMSKLVPLLSDKLTDLDTLLPYLPEEQRTSIVGGAYKHAFKIGDAAAFVAACTALASRLSGDEAQEAIALACSAQGIEDEDELAIVHLVVSGSRVLPEEKGRAFIQDVFRSLERQPAENASLFGAAIALSPRLTTAEADALADSAIEAMADRAPIDEDMIALTILLFSSKLSEACRMDVFRRYFSFLKESVAKEEAEPGPASILSWATLFPLIPMPPEPEARGYLNLALQRLRSANGEERCLAYAVAALSSHLSEAQAEELACQSMALAAASTNETEVNAIAVSLLAPYLPDRIFSVSIPPLLDILSTMERSHLLSVISIIDGSWGDILGLAPALAQGAAPRSWLQRVGGDAAVSETFASVQDVQRWWP
jgi:hypothetical protein